MQADSAIWDAATAYACGESIDYILWRYLGNDTRLLWLADLARDGELGREDAREVAAAIRMAHGLRSMTPVLDLLIKSVAGDDPLIDTPAAGSAYALLDDDVTVWRGDYENWRDLPWAPSWTLDPDIAQRFTLRGNGVARRLSVPKSAIRAVLFDRDESEVLILNPGPRANTEVTI